MTLILLLAFLLRIWLNMSLPVFWDEGLHLSRAYAAERGQMFYWNIRKWLYPVFLSLFNPGGIESLWLARTLSALLGTLAAGCCIRLGRDLYSDSAGLLAGLIYAVLPLAVFHERQALSDPLLATMLTVMLVCSVWVARKPRWWQMFILGGSFAAAYLTKISALPYTAIPFAAVILLGKGRRSRLMGFVISLLGIITAIAIIAWTYTYVLQHGGLQTTAWDVTQQKIGELATSNKQGNSLPLDARIVGGTNYVITGLLTYAGPGMLLLLVFAAIWAIRGVKRWELVFLAIPGVVFLMGPLIAQKPVDASRYLLPNAVPLVALGAMAFAITQEWFGSFGPTRARIVGAMLALLVFLPLVWFDDVLLIDPPRSPLTQIDHSQYFDNTPAGGPYALAAAYLAQQWRESEGRKVDVLSSGSANFIQAYMGPRVMETAGFDKNTLPDELADWLAHGDRVFFMDDSLDGHSAQKFEAGTLTLLETYRDNYRTIKLYELTDLHGSLADAVYGKRVPDVGHLADGFAAAGQELSQTPDQAVYVFPATHTQPLVDQGVAAKPLAIGEWPLKETDVDKFLAGLDRDSEAALINLILIDENNADPKRLIQREFQQRYYRVGEGWYGLLHRITFATGPPNPTFESIGAKYEGGIELVAHSEVDQPLRSNIISLALQWRTPVPIQDSFSVFVHLVDSSGNLVAQYDGVPGGGLLPMPIWQPGELITDRFALILPTDLPPGDYSIRVGIYSQASGLRLRVISAPEGSGDYVTAMHLTLP